MENCHKLGYDIIKDNSNKPIKDISDYDFEVRMPCKKCNEIYIEKHFNMFSMPIDYGYVCDKCRKVLDYKKELINEKSEVIRRNWIKERDKILKKMI